MKSVADYLSSRLHTLVCSLAKHFGVPSSIKGGNGAARRADDATRRQCEMRSVKDDELMHNVRRGALSCVRRVNEEIRAFPSPPAPRRRLRGLALRIAFGLPVKHYYRTAEFPRNRMESRVYELRDPNTRVTMMTRARARALQRYIQTLGERCRSARTARSRNKLCNRTTRFRVYLLYRECFRAKHTQIY